MSILKTVKDKAEEIGQAVSDLAHSRYTDAKEKERRIGICVDCEYFFKSAFACKKCGCYLGLKTEFLNSKCPLNKW